MLKSLASKLRQYFVVNPRHIDAMDVYTPVDYRRAMRSGYEAPTSPFDKVSNIQYFKRDIRRQYPRTIVVTPADLTAIDKPVQTANGVVPGETVTLNYSDHTVSPYPTLTFYK